MSESGENWNVHHVFWERRHYKTSLEKRLRSHPGFIIPVTVVSHDALHRDLKPPIKPNHEQIVQLMMEVNQYEGDRLHDLRVAENFFYEAARSGIYELREDAFHISENLAEQIYYLADGYEYDNPVGKLVYPGATHGTFL